MIIDNHTVSRTVSFHWPDGCSPHVCTDMNGQSSKPVWEWSLGLLDSNSASVPAYMPISHALSCSLGLLTFWDADPIVDI